MNKIVHDEARHIAGTVHQARLEAELSGNDVTIGFSGAEVTVSPTCKPEAVMERIAAVTPAPYKSF